MTRIPTPDSNDLRLKADEPSLLFAIQELIRTGGGINFDEWFDEWKKLKAGNSAELTKYKQIKIDAVKPKFYDITPKNSKSGLKFIWYMPDGEEASGVPLSGTDSQLVEHVVQLEYEGGGELSDRQSAKNSKPPLAGLPNLKLFFCQPWDTLLPSQKSPTTGEKSIRCVGYSDNERIVAMGLAKKVTNNLIKEWANQIVKNFAGYEWKRGQGCLSYNGLTARYQGVEGYAFCQTKSVGKQLFTSLLKIFDYKPDPSCFNWSEATDPKEKFKEGDRLPVTVTFDRASYESTYNASKKIKIVKRGVVLIK